MLRPAVSKPYKKICSPSSPLSQFLYGDGLQKRTKDLNETKKFTQEISTNKYKKKYVYSDSLYVPVGFLLLWHLVYVLYLLYLLFTS